MTLSGAVHILEKMGFVPNLDNEFLLHGVTHRLVVLDNVVMVETPNGNVPWADLFKKKRKTA